MVQFIAHRARSAAETQPRAKLRCTLQVGTNPPAVLEVNGEIAVLGSASTCDVRLPDFVSPPLFCILTLAHDGLRVRRLVDEPRLVRVGSTEPVTLIRDGDLLTVGPCRIAVQFSLSERPVAAASAPEITAERVKLGGDVEAESLAARRKQFEDERRDWEQDAERQAETLALRSRQLLDQEKALALATRDLEGKQQSVQQAKAEVAALERELVDLRDQLYARFSRRRDRLVQFKSAVARAAAKVQVEKRSVEAEAAALEQEREAWKSSVGAQGQALSALQAREEAALAQHRLIEEWQKDTEADMKARRLELDRRQAIVADAEAELAIRQTQQQADLARVEQLHAELTARHCKVSEREAATSHRELELDHITTELEKQVGELDAWESRLEARDQALRQRDKLATTDPEGGELVGHAPAASRHSPFDASGPHPLATTWSEPTREAALEPMVVSLRKGISDADAKLVRELDSVRLLEANLLEQLIEDAGRRRASLRDALLDSNALTLFQLERIESGRVNELVIGNLRVQDELRTGTHEAIYRVLDVERNVEMLLRQPHPRLGAERKADYFACFESAAAVRHENVAAIERVLDWPRGRAVLQEWPHGLPSDEWKGHAATPAVGLRLLKQATSGLAAIHARGLVHGRLHAGRLLLTKAGVIKICGIGEPGWLTGEIPRAQQAPSAVDDLRALARIAQGWFNGANGRGSREVSERLRLLLKPFTEPQAEAAPLLANIVALLAEFGSADNGWQQLVTLVGKRLEGAGQELAEAA